MDIGQLKQLVNKIGGLVIVTEGNPEFVVLTYNKFKELDGVPPGSKPVHGGVENGFYFEDVVARETNGFVASQPNQDHQDHEEIERLNQEILTLKEEIRQRESAELALSEEDPGVTAYID